MSTLKSFWHRHLFLGFLLTTSLGASFFCSSFPLSQAFLSHLENWPNHLFPDATLSFVSCYFPSGFFSSQCHPCASNDCDGCIALIRMKFQLDKV